MRDEFGFEAIRSVEFCVSVKENHEQQNYLVPSDRHVQDALRAMLDATVRQLETPGELADAPEWQQFEVSERYASKEALIAALDSCPASAPMRQNRPVEEGRISGPS